MITDERLSNEEQQKIVAAFVPAECDADACQDPFCPYLHCDSYGDYTRTAYLLARELQSRREADEWKLVHDAPAACHVMAARWDESEWVYGVVMSPPSKPWTHFRPLPQPPQGSTP